MKKILVVAAIVSLVFSGGCIQNNNYQSIESSVPTLNVQGEGKVIAIPDEAIISFGVKSDAKRLAKAYRDNTSKMNAVINTVKGMGLEDKDIKTSSYNISPIYPRDEKGRTIPGQPVSFRVSQQLTVKVRDIAITGELIDKVISSGTNMFSGIQFTSSELEKLQEQAKAKAAVDSKKEAELLANSLGAKVGRILRVNSSFAQPYPTRNTMAFEAASMRSAPKIQAGSMEVKATCNVVYELVQ